MKQTPLIFFLLICLSATGISGQQCPKARRPLPPRTSRPAELRGSREQRVEQNIKAMNLGLNQIKTNQELLALATAGNLLELKNTDYHIVDRGILPAIKLRRGKKMVICPPKENKVFVRAHIPSYIDLLAHDFFQEFQKKLKITSGARSLEEQILMKTKGSCYYTPHAATARDSLEESLHIRGVVIDISRRVVATVKGKQIEMPMSRKETDWIRKRLIADKLNGVEFEIKNREEPIGLETDPIEERTCYHIVVFPKS